jgi:L-fuconolactonase
MAARRIDAHQHFWHYTPGEYEWIDESMRRIRRDFMPADLQREMTPLGFDGTVLVQVRQSLEETLWMLDIADSEPMVEGVVGWADLRAPEIADHLRDLSRRPKLLGIRHVVQSEPDGFLLEPSFLAGIRALGQFDLTYDILIYERQLPEAIEFASRFPEQRFVLDHLGKPNIRRGAIDPWRQHLRTLAKLPNVWCKLSGIVTEADWDTWTPDQIRPYLETAVECFGANRVMIGSDWPVCTLAATYAETMGLVTDLVADWSENDRDAVLGGTATSLWRLDRRASS